jgi:parallel beta-helix repeat protein
MSSQGTVSRRPSRGRTAAQAVLGVLLVTLAAAAVPSARAAQLPCGSVITKNTTLKQDIGPCQLGGVTVTGNSTLDLGGHRIFGATETGDGIGIRLVNATGATVTNGTVSGFDAGIVIVQGGSNQIRGIKAIANVGQAGVTDFGDGILIDRSPSNVINGNEIRSNGPFSGISVIGSGSVGNKIAKNTVQNNDVPSNATENNDVGIRLEAGTEQTTLKSNVVTFSGLDGVAIFQNSRRNVLISNTAKGNGFHDKTHRRGDGIRVFGVPGPDENVLRTNLVQDNAANGIALANGASANLLQRNKASRNGFAVPGSFDLADENVGCDQNSWVKNVFGSRSAACIQ